MVEDKFKAILTEIKNDKGPVNVFAIVKVDDFVDKWSVIFSAPWVNSQNSSEIFNYLRELLLMRLSDEEKSTIARIGVFPTTEHIVNLISNSIRVEDGGVASLKDAQLNGYKIHEAYIFESNPITLS